MARMRAQELESPGRSGEPDSFCCCRCLAASEEILIGGPGRHVGVMMRSPQSYAVAVRRPSGTLAVTQNLLRRPGGEVPYFQIPAFPLLGTPGQALVLGVRPRTIRPRKRWKNPLCPRQEKGESLQVSGLNLAISIGFFILFYKFLPLYLVMFAKHITRWPATCSFSNLLYGTIWLVLFLALLIARSKWKRCTAALSISRRRARGGGAHEKGCGRGCPHRAPGRSRFHPRCGTKFLLVVMGVAMLLLPYPPFQSFAAKFVWRLLLLPVIAGISYEFIRFAAKKKGSLWRWGGAQPGLRSQPATTREPDDSQLETAIMALETTMAAERSRAASGPTLPRARPDAEGSNQ